MEVILTKLKEVIFSVLPITVLVIILNFTLTPIENIMMIRFLIGSTLITVGVTIFLFGVDNGVTPIGNIMGNSIVKSNKLYVVIFAGLILGFFISVAEPDLHILSSQVNTVTNGMISSNVLVVAVSLGVATLISLGLMRIVYNFPLKKMLLIAYSLIFALSLFSSQEFLAIAFDASGATTGALTVPFILALATGVSNLKKDRISNESDSFGLVGIASAGAIIPVLIMSIITNADEITGSLENVKIVSDSIISPFINQIIPVSIEAIMALTPILIIFLISNKFAFKLSKTKKRKILFGILFTFIGLVIFLIGVNAGFMEVGAMIGYELAVLDNKIYIFLIAMILGMVTIIAEPAVYVLTHQIEDVTSGHIKKKTVLFSLAIGVAFSVGFSIVRVLVPSVKLWHFLLPGYIIALVLSFIVPELFVGIAFDSGGVASGPMTATFILSFTQGAAEAVEGANVLIDGFGVIALVAMTPIITLQLLGLIYKFKSK